MLKFGREWALYIGINTELNDRNIPKDSPKLISESSVENSTKPNTDYTTIPDQAIVYTGRTGEGVRIEAEIGQTKKGTDKTMITLYNVDPQTVSRFKRDASIILKAGYEQDFSLSNDDLNTGYEALPTVYCGQVHSVKSESYPPDIITKIICADGSTVRRNVKISKSWPPGTTNAQIVQDMVSLANKSGIPTGAVRLASDSPTTIDNSNWGGYSASGNLYEELDKVVQANKLEMYHTQGKLFVSQPGNSGRQAYLLLPENIIGKVTLSSDIDVDQSNADEGTQSTIQVSTWLDPLITTDNYITLQGTDFDGDYRISKVKHSMDSHSTKWTTTITGIRL